MHTPDYRYWSVCTDCQFEGLFDFRRRPDELYDDPELLGVLLDAHCPACDTHETVLVAREEFDEMVFVTRQQSATPEGDCK
ncbi:MAG: hypothetical protein CMO26_22440 [Thiotrichales bacterium]|nr:hypothetical protein [Thiotrichales bacterium]|tara:strand:- start:417 stop:659 length:243 start_codon:yes stop_codon:yes gene_type:complete